MEQKYNKNAEIREMNRPWRLEKEINADTNSYKQNS